MERGLRKCLSDLFWVTKEKNIFCWELVDFKNILLAGSSYLPALLEKNYKSSIFLAGNFFPYRFAGWEKHSNRLMLAGTEDRLFFSHES